MICNTSEMIILDVVKGKDNAFYDTWRKGINAVQRVCCSELKNGTDVFVVCVFIVCPNSNRWVRLESWPPKKHVWNTTMSHKRSLHTKIDKTLVENWVLALLARRERCKVSFGCHGHCLHQVLSDNHMLLKTRLEPQLSQSFLSYKNSCLFCFASN